MKTNYENQVEGNCYLSSGFSLLRNNHTSTFILDFENSCHSTLGTLVFPICLTCKANPHNRISHQMCMYLVTFTTFSSEELNTSMPNSSIQECMISPFSQTHELYSLACIRRVCYLHIISAIYGQAKKT